MFDAFLYDELFCFCGAGDKSGGCVRGLYDPTLSERGVLLCAARKPRAKDPLDFEVSSLYSAPNTQSCNNRTCMVRLHALSIDAARMALCIGKVLANYLQCSPESKPFITRLCTPTQLD